MRIYWRGAVAVEIKDGWEGYSADMPFVAEQGGCAHLGVSSWLELLCGKLENGLKARLGYSGKSGGGSDLLATRLLVYRGEMFE
eukprot:scaffold186300_cov34-Attheya_sp.AAC.1